MEIDPSSGIIPGNDAPGPLDPVESATNSFIVIIRFVSSRHVDKTVNWRGSVEHVQTHDRIYFIDFSKLVEFIAMHGGISAARSNWQQNLARLWQDSGLHKWLHTLKQVQHGDHDNEHGVISGP